jgi:hypothetical protein
MSANKFVLKHQQIEIYYTIGITPGLTALTYKDGNNVKKFKTSGRQLLGAVHPGPWRIDFAVFFHGTITNGLTPF